MNKKIKKITENIENVDILIDIYKILKINELTIYTNNLIYMDKNLKNKLLSIIDYHLKLPDDYVTVISENKIMKKTGNLLHYELMKIFNKLQKKYYNDDKFGISIKVQIISSFFEDVLYICDVYNNNDQNNIKYLNWIKNYNIESVYIETNN